MHAELQMHYVHVWFQKKPSMKSQNLDVLPVGGIDTPLDDFILKG